MNNDKTTNVLPNGMRTMEMPDAQSAFGPFDEDAERPTGLARALRELADKIEKAWP